MSSRGAPVTDFSVASETDSADLTRLTLTVPADVIESARGVLGDVMSEGWSEARRDDVWSLAVWVPSRLRDDAVATLTERFAASSVPMDVTAAAESDDWRDAMRRIHVPVDIRGRLRVRPPWEPARDDVPEIVIDPGMAFGTGQHATTKGCLELLVDVSPGSVLDVGCGSGLLAIAARKLGHDPVHAVDYDPLAVEATDRNAEVNDVSVVTTTVDATEASLPHADIVLANITRHHVRGVAGRLAITPRVAILSGFTERDIESATGPWLDRGMRITRTSVVDGWAAVRLDRT